MRRSWNRARALPSPARHGVGETGRSFVHSSLVVPGTPRHERALPTHAAHRVISETGRIVRGWYR